MNKFKFLNKNKILKLPETAGVYIFKDKKDILYIGKAINIKERVNQHRKLINLAEQIGYIKTNSEIEALILEANLIKKYQPKYNVMWRDDKNYFYVAVTKKDFPRIYITHQPIKNERGLASFIGPFIDGKSLKKTLETLRKVFPYRSCKRMPAKPCLWYHLNRCKAPCLLKSSLAKEINLKAAFKKESRRNAKNLLKILQGKTDKTMKDLKKEMKKASILKAYEKAARIRDQISALEKIMSHARIFEIQPPISNKWQETQRLLQKILNIKKEISRIEAYDVSNIQGKEATGAMVTFIEGFPDKNLYRRFKIKIQGKPDDIAMLKEILKRRLKHPEWQLPDLLLIDGGKAQFNAAKSEAKNRIKIMAIAKKKNELYLEGKSKPLLLENLPREIFNLILQLRDEAHRFAIAYHKKLRTYSLLS